MTANILDQLGIPKDALLEKEASLMPYISENPLDYLFARNFIVQYWHSQSELLTLEQVEKLEDLSTNNYKTEAFLFLDRHRYINYGLLKTKILKRDPESNIYIIGGGIAGASAARELINIYSNQTEPMPNIKILESRQRIGGRLFTFPLHSKWGDMDQPGIDLGPNNFEPDTFVLKIISQIGLELLKEDFTPVLFDDNGQIIDKSITFAANEFFQEIFNDCKNTILTARPTKQFINQSLGKLLNQQLENHPLYPRLNELHLKLIKFSISQLELKYNCMLEKISIKSPGLFDQSDCYSIKGGIGQLCHALLYGLDENYETPQIICDTKVEKISLLKDSIEINANRDTFEADVVVMTVPISLLKNNAIQFTPKLPSKKVEAMENIEMGISNKIVLVFPRIFWPLQYNSFGILQDNLLFINQYHKTNLPCLIVHCSGNSALEMENRTDEELVDEIMKKLSKIFYSENPLPYPIETIVTRWQKDKYSLGCRTVLSTANPDCFSDLKQDSSRLFWAGEYASLDQPGTINGKFC
ncbi:hypothetical protein HK103_003945 [Boothiomyces macroporosus]|uniref:SWIRM domain-containing protein n=1 Tax=Boothiomyces macroporosus TaxID=261099 RepID=A0AAD5UMD0_9FUNG|nr:hypothetical protein HK103_003945 [Boothiomyces macroporosus]